MSASFPIPQAPSSTQTELELDVATPEAARPRQAWRHGPRTQP